MKELLALTIVAVLVEGLVEILKSIKTDEGVNKVVILSILVGLLFAFTTRLDILELVGLEAHIPYVGLVATGIFASRGSNYVHDLIDKLKGE
jgi:hypothetical protein